MSSKDWVAEVLYRARVTDRLIRPSADQLIVLGYHRIRADDGGFESPFDDGTFGPTLTCFREQMRWLKTHTTVLAEADLIDLVQSGRRWPQPSSLVTFDDGYRDQYARALPVLRELEVPAIFFVPTQLIQTRKLGWWDIIAYFIKKTAKESIFVEGRRHVLGKRAYETISYFQESMKVRPEDETAKMLAKLSEVCAVSFPSAEAQDAELMSWADIRDALRQGISFGSHSHTHRVLTTLPASAAAEELQISKAILEAETGREVKTVAYPCGSYEHFSSVTQHLAEEAGYVLGFSFNTGVNRWMDIARFDIRRLGASARPSRVAAVTCFPTLFAWGTGRTKRAQAQVRTGI